MRELSEQVTIAVTQQAAWEALSDFGGVADWAPYMQKSWLIGHPRQGVGARRGMRHAWGFRFEEAITEWNEGSGYSFDVFRAPFPMKEVKESWIAEPDAEQSTITTRVSYGMRLGLLGSLLDGLLVRFIVRREMRAGLRGLKRFLEDKHN